MKLAIFTQYRENYGDEDQPYWKNKGGDVYYFENLREKDIARIQKYGIHNIGRLLSRSNSMVQEYVCDWSIVADGEVCHQPWEDPIYLTYNKVAKVFKAKQVVHNDEYHCLLKEIRCIIKTWDLVQESESNFDNYKQEIIKWDSE